MKASGRAAAPARGLAALRRLAQEPPLPEVEYCDLCSATLAPQHDHLIDPRTRRLRCACQACAILFGSGGETTYRRTPRDIRNMGNLELDDRMWAALDIPINLAFLFRSSASGEALAVYPSPAGPTETAIDSETWDDLLAENPELSGMEADVEALLINRIKTRRDHLIVPIDECYKLTGIVRRYWRGFSGGEEACRRIEHFFDDLKSRSRAPEVSIAESVI